MLVMTSSHTSELHGWLCGRFPGLVGHLFSTDGKFNPYPFAPYALDNGAFPAWVRGLRWDDAAWLKMLDRAAACPHVPRWALVPDVVCDRERTIEQWHKYLPFVLQRGFVPAFAVQDGMTDSDLPAEAQVLFVGGSTDWKWRSLPAWAATGRRVHVGRVNYPTQLAICQAHGVESVDGTGWFRGDDKQLGGLIRFLENDQSAGCGQDSDYLARRGDSRPLSFFGYRDSAGSGGHYQQTLF